MRATRAIDRWLVPGRQEHWVTTIVEREALRSRDIKGCLGGRTGVGHGPRNKRCGLGRGGLGPLMAGSVVKKEGPLSEDPGRRSLVVVDSGRPIQWVGGGLK